MIPLPGNRDLQALGLLTLLLLCLTLPFVTRAYFVDDFYFVTMAKGILEHPGRPYDFISDDAGLGQIAWEKGQPPRMVNPPLFHYFLADVIGLWGDSVWKLRTASLIFPLISLFAAYYLGKRFVKNSLAAASLLAVTPAFWLTSYSLLIDSALLAFVLAALVCFVEGHEQKRFEILAVSGMLMGAALLTKYPGFLVIALVLGWHLLHRDTCTWQGTALSLGVCGLIFLAWGVWNIRTYGQMHFIATFARGFHPAASKGLVCLMSGLFGLFLHWKYPAKPMMRSGAAMCWTVCLYSVMAGIWKSHSLGEFLGTFYIDKMISVASFLGGCLVFLFFAPYEVARRSRRAGLYGGGIVLTLFVVFVSRFGGFDRLQSGTLAFFIGCTLAFLSWIGLEISSKSPPSHQFLLGWLTLGLLELIVVMPWTAARYLLIVVPPACWFFRRFMEDSGRLRLWWTAWAATAAMGAVLAYVDYAQAGVIVSMAQKLGALKPQLEKLSPHGKNHWVNLADTFDGAQPYLAPLGWENAFPDQKFARGTLVLRRYYRKSSWWAIPDLARFKSLDTWEFDSRIPLRVMDVPASAGFYASAWGTLPYALTHHPLERFELYWVK